MALDKKRKKIIAREFIVFIISLLLTLFAFLWTVIVNYRHSVRISNLRAQFAQNVHEGDSLAKVREAKLKNHYAFYYQLNKHIDLSGAGYSVEMLWSALKRLSDHDSIGVKYWVWQTENKDAFVKIGFKSPEALNRFIVSNTITQLDDENDKNSERAFNRNYQISNKISKYKQDQYTSSEQRWFSLYSFLVIISITFVLRHIYYGIRWSISILQES